MIDVTANGETRNVSLDVSTIDDHDEYIIETKRT